MKGFPERSIPVAARKTPPAAHKVAWAQKSLRRASKIFHCVDLIFPLDRLRTTNLILLVRLFEGFILIGSCLTYQGSGMKQNIPGSDRRRKEKKRPFRTIDFSPPIHEREKALSGKFLSTMPIGPTREPAANREQQSFNRLPTTKGRKKIAAKFPETGRNNVCQ